MNTLLIEDNDNNRGEISKVQQALKSLLSSPLVRNFQQNENQLTFYKNTTRQYEYKLAISLQQIITKIDLMNFGIQENIKSSGTFFKIQKINANGKNPI